MRAIILLLIPCLSFAQSYHDTDGAAYLDATRQLSFCVGDMASVRQGQIIVSEPLQNRITITFPDVIVSCTDPFTELYYGPLTVNGEEAARYRILYWERDQVAPETFIIETTQHRYSLPLPNMVGYEVFVEAYDSLGNSDFYTYEGNVLVRYTGN